MNCPFCESAEDTWFDRTIMYDHNGCQLEYETFATRCSDCGKNVNAPLDYYIDNLEVPLPTQKLVDDIDNLINNKPAIADQSDYIQIINNIQKLIAGWRETNDPCYEKEV